MTAAICCAVTFVAEYRDNRISVGPLINLPSRRLRQALEILVLAISACVCLPLPVQLGQQTMNKLEIAACRVEQTRNIPVWPA